MDIEAIWTAIGKYVSIWIAFIILIMSITACGRKDTRYIVSEVLSLDASGGSEILNYDTHSGNGDGTSCIVLHFKEDAVLKEIQENKWNAFPLDETVKTLVYGTEDGGGKYGPYLTDQDGNPLIPEIRNGYYRLIDRQIKMGEASGADILHRNSFNFDLGLYDADTNTLYFCRMDT